MAPADVEVVRALIEADDLAAALVHIHPEVEWIPLRAATEGAYFGSKERALEAAGLSS